MSLAYMKPVVWSVQDGILVRDLKKSDCKAALDFLKKWHLTSSVLLHTFNVKHCCSSLMSFFQIVYYIMKDETSLLAIDDDTQEIVGVLVGKPMIRENWSWWVQIWLVLTEWNIHGYVYDAGTSSECYCRRIMFLKLLETLNVIWSWLMFRMQNTGTRLPVITYLLYACHLPIKVLNVLLPLVLLSIAHILIFNLKLS